MAAELDRRDFLKVLGGGLLVCLTHASAWTQEAGRGFGGHELPKDVGAWLHIAADGRVKVFTGKVEVGQNIRTSLAQLVAEELRVPFDSITMVMGDTDLVPWDMGTFGSRSTPTMGPQLRTMAAAARGDAAGDGRGALAFGSANIDGRRTAKYPIRRARGR
jgi:CO/xanthine dehydrogenase Mo-binding subunit